MPAQKLNRAIKYRAYPTSEQQVLLAKTFGCVRFIWNHMLIDAQQFLDEAGTFFVPTPAKYKKEFPFFRKLLFVCYVIPDKNICFATIIFYYLLSLKNTFLKNIKFSFFSFSSMIIAIPLHITP